MFSYQVIRVKYPAYLSRGMSEAQTVTDTGSVVRDLTAFQQNILIILAEEPMYGLAIKRQLETYYGTEVNHGRLYPNLDDLVEMGLVEKSELDKRTNQYELTSEGHDALLDQFEWMVEKFVTGEERAAELTDLISAHQ
jgi:DNA-binding PadR family transcriptional regulator